MVIQFVVLYSAIIVNYSMNKRCRSDGRIKKFADLDAILMHGAIKYQFRQSLLSNTWHIILLGSGPTCNCVYVTGKV